MENKTIKKVHSLTNQLNQNNLKLANAKSDKEIKTLLRQNDILVKKRAELVKQLRQSKKLIINLNEVNNEII